MYIVYAPNASPEPCLWYASEIRPELWTATSPSFSLWIIPGTITD